MDSETTDTASAEGAGEVTLSTGVVVRGRPVPDEVLARVFKRARDNEPKVPMWTDPAKGREEPNPNDPDYLEAKRRAATDLAMFSANALIMYGVEVVSIPDGFAGPDSPEWRDELALSGMASGAGAVGRLFDWLTIKAAPHERNLLLRIAGRATGTLEVDVDEATKSV